jgi:nucleosome binding factor SPN SPT16 subunit
MFRFATGVEFRDNLLLINEKCTQLVQKNMTFVVTLGLQNFPNREAKEQQNKTVSLLIGDTVLVSEVSGRFNGNFNKFVRNFYVKPYKFKITLFFSSLLKEGAAEILTANAKNRLRAVSIRFRQQDEEEMGGETVEETGGRRGRPTRSVVLPDQTRV